MYALAPPAKRKHTTPNLLPCKIHHNGPIPTSPRYWSPTTTTTTDHKVIKTSYFRGRKLQGRTLRLPEGYTGLVLQKTDKVAPKPRPTVEEMRAMEEEGERLDDVGVLGEDVQVKMLEQKAEFEELIVWGHEVVPDGEDVYVRAVEEWVGFAEAMHCDDQPTTANGTT